jgi:hypothetical protein
MLTSGPQLLHNCIPADHPRASRRLQPLYDPYPPAGQGSKGGPACFEKTRRQVSALPLRYVSDIHRIRYLHKICPGHIFRVLTRRTSRNQVEVVIRNQQVSERRDLHEFETRERRFQQRYSRGVAAGKEEASGPRGSPATSSWEVKGARSILSIDVFLPPNMLHTILGN